MNRVNDKKNLTPLKSIRNRCIDCSGLELIRGRNCEHLDCMFYPVRMGRGARAVLRLIRGFCLWCCKGQKYEIRLCPAATCPVWPYRLGRRPQKSISLPEIVTTEGVLETNKEIMYIGSRLFALNTSRISMLHRQQSGRDIVRKQRPSKGQDC
jgi:hypothetical protein